MRDPLARIPDRAKIPEGGRWRARFGSERFDPLARIPDRAQIPEGGRCRARSRSMS
jgi:hypothetical protein